MATHSSILAWENPMDRGAWWAAAHGVGKGWRCTCMQWRLLLPECFAYNLGSFAYCVPI